MRILFVAFGSSIHTARWINQLSNENWDIHLFPVDEFYLHPDLRDITVHLLFKRHAKHIHSSVRQASLSWPFRRGETRFRDTIQRLPKGMMSNAARLARLIRSLKPDIVHSLEMQNGAYLTLDSRDRISGGFPTWVYSVWGNDIFYFGKQPEHEARIRAVLASCDYLMADCERDVDLACQFGFKGQVSGVFPTGGGFDIDHLRQSRQPGKVSSRRVIALKGRQDHLGGRALVALQALHMCADVLGEYEIVVYMPQGDSIVTHAAKYIAFATGLRIRVMPENSSHDEIIKLMGSARMAISVAMTDGTPNAMLEAMVMGAFPIQSNTAATQDWIEDGKNGALVPPEDPDSIAAAIRRAVSDDEMVDRAAEINSQLTRERIDQSLVTPKVIDAYKKIAAGGPAQKGAKSWG